MKMAFLLTGLLLLLGAVGPASAEPYENCKTSSYGHCMACGERYGWHGEVQRKFCWGLPGTPEAGPRASMKPRATRQ
jgi:hypothetical protein